MSCDGLSDVQNSDQLLNVVSFVWSPLRPATLSFKVNCLSTEFAARKHGGWREREEKRDRDKERERGRRGEREREERRREYFPNYFSIFFKYPLFTKILLPFDLNHRRGEGGPPSVRDGHILR